MMQKTAAEMLAELLKDCGVSQRKLAESMGCSPQVINSRFRNNAFQSGRLAVCDSAPWLPGDAGAGGGQPPDGAAAGCLPQVQESGRWHHLRQPEGHADLSPVAQ